MNQVQPPNGDLHTSRMTSSCIASSQATKTFTSITLHRNEIGQWVRCHCACLVNPHRMICNITYLGQLSGHIIWPDLRSNFHMNLSGSKIYKKNLQNLHVHKLHNLNLQNYEFTDSFYWLHDIFFVIDV